MITNFPKPNYKFWDTLNRLDQFQVVCLWAEFEPNLKASEEEICHAIQGFLTEARKEGLLRSDVSEENDYIVSFLRRDLIAYAERMDMRPAFLYPEERTILDAPIRTDNSPTTNPAAPPSEVKVEDLPDTAVELPKKADVQKTQSETNENAQPVISEHEYPKEICELFDPLPKSAISEAKVEDLPDTAVELSEKEDVQKTQIESNENEQPVISLHEYPKEICDLFEPLPKSAIILLFPISNINWISKLDKASSNGLIKARIGRSKFNPAKIATWLIQKGLITQHHADAKLKKALPPRSKDNPIADDYFNKYEID